MSIGRFLCVAVMVLGSTASAAEPGKPLRTLWAGSSSLYYHNQPKICAEWLTRSGTPATAELVGRSGTGIHVYLRPEFKAEYGLKAGQTVLEKIAAGKYDFVVLQVPAEFINGPEGDEHDKSLDIYCRAIRAVGGKPLIYEMGWGRDEKAEVGRQKIFAAAVRNKVSHFAPCSTAWRRVRREKPELELQNPPDTAHPGTLGCYLNLCCFVAAFTGKPPADAPLALKIWRKPTDEQKKELDQRVAAVQFDEYDTALAGWMKRLVVAAKTETIDEATAGYLRTVAAEEYAALQKRLRDAGVK